MGDSDQSDDEEGSLRRAFEHVKAMREENAVLRHNFEDVSSFLFNCLSLLSWAAAMTPQKQVAALTGDSYSTFHTEWHKNIVLMFPIL